MKILGVSLAFNFRQVRKLLVEAVVAGAVVVLTFLVENIADLGLSVEMTAVVSLVLQVLLQYIRRVFRDGQQGTPP